MQMDKCLIYQLGILKIMIFNCITNVDFIGKI